MSVDYTTHCGCNQPIHYTSSAVQDFCMEMIAKLGATVDVTVIGSTDTYKVPRHYLALHGIAAADVPELAARYGWEKV